MCDYIWRIKIIDMKKETALELPKENRLGTEKEGKLLLKMSVPMMISMLVLALYNIVDTYFVAKISEEATSALTIAFPFQMIISSIAVGTSVGISSLISRRLGESDQSAADNAASVGMLLLILSGIVVSLVYFFFSEAFMKLFATNETELDHATLYLRICGSLSTFVMLGVASEKILQGTGNAIKPMITQLVGALTNMVLDPVLIFGYGIFPKLEVAGAAYATVAGQIVSMITGLIFLFGSRNKKVRISFRGLKIQASVIRAIYDVGLPSIVMQSIASFVTMGIYGIINSYIKLSLQAKCVLGIYFKVQSFIFMPVFGLNSGSLSIMAYNYGAKRRKRFMRTLKLSLICAMLITCTGLAMFQIFPDKILGIFDSVGNDPETVKMGIRALRIISLCFPFAAVGIIITGAFNAVGKGIYALIVSAARQVVVILPAAFLLAKFVDCPNGTAIAFWWAYPIAEGMGLTMSLLLFGVVNKKYLSKLDALHTGESVLSDNVKQADI